MNLLKKLMVRLSHRELSKLDALYQRHAGEECYIIGDGVTMKWMDLRRFTDRLAIIGNFLIYHRDVAVLNAPYCTLTEPYWFWRRFPRGGVKQLNFVRNTLNEEYRRSIEQFPAKTFFLNLSNFPVARFPNALFVSRWYTPPGEGSNPFRDRPDSQESTLKFQISLAIFLGFKKAYLVGQDYTHFPSRIGHYYEKGPGVKGTHETHHAEFFDYAKRHIELATITLDGTSNTLEAVTYEKFTGAKPLYRENTDLLDDVKLKSLARWKWYQIF